MLRRMMTEGAALKAEGRSLLIFPEGTRVPPGERPSLKSGFAGLYKVLKLPVVPVAWYRQNAVTSDRVDGFVLDPLERTFGISDVTLTS